MAHRVDVCRSLLVSVAVLASVGCNPASTGLAGYPFDGTWTASASTATGWDGAVIASTQTRQALSGTVTFADSTITFTGNELDGIVTLYFGPDGVEFNKSFTGTFATADTLSGTFFGGQTSMTLVRVSAGGP
jgi:hypothetical protein